MFAVIRFNGFLSKYIFSLFVCRKRTAAKQRIERYYFQLKEGCGKSDCSNVNCASSPEFAYKDISNNDAGLKAIELFKSHAQLCDSKPCKMARNGDNHGVERTEVLPGSSSTGDSPSAVGESTSDPVPLEQPSTLHEPQLDSASEAAGTSGASSSSQASGGASNDDDMSSSVALVEALDKFFLNLKSNKEEPKPEPKGNYWSVIFE